MRTAFRKVWRDLWRSKGRTLLVVMSIAIGVLAVGMIMSSTIIINRQLRLSHKGSQPSHAQAFLNGRIDQDTVDQLSRLPEIKAIEGRLTAGIRWKTSLSGEWQDGSLRALPDYKNQNFDLIELRQGSWPSRNTTAVAFNHIQPFGLPDVGDKIYFEINERERSIEISGAVRDPFELSPPFTQQASFYIDHDLFRKITGFDSYSQLRFTVPEYSEENVETAGDAIEKNLRRQGVTIGFIQSFDPDEHFTQSTVDGVNLILTVMAIASLGLSTFIIINTMNALMMQQVPQIGIMKTVGGLSPQIATIYLTGVAVYGLLGLLIAVPIGSLGGYILSQWLLTILNVTTTPFHLVPIVFALQIGAGLLVPLLAALWPVFRGVALSVREALSAYGVGSGQYGTRFLDRVVSRIQSIPRLAALTLRNTFRRPGRVALTQITLVSAGAIFMTVLSTQLSFNRTIDKVFASLGFDVFVVFEQPQLIDEIIPLVETRPQVTLAEMWVFANGFSRGVDQDSSEEFEIVLRGIPRDTQLYEPELVAGRDLDPDDGHALLLNQKIAEDMGVGVGDRIVLDLGNNGESIWTIVGLILDLAPGPDQNSAYLYQDTLNQELNRVGRADVVEVRGSRQTLETQLSIEKDLTEHFESLGKGIAFSMTAIENKEQANAQFNIITTILLIMTVLIALVGSLGLSGMLSINVLERRREIGVMRAVGASSWDVSRIFMGEGVMLGVFSWAQAVPLSLFGGRFFVDALAVILEFPFSYTYSVQSVWLWLGIVIVLSLIASWVPSRRATQISVNESLAYE